MCSTVETVQCKSGGEWYRFASDYTYEDGIVFANETGVNNCAKHCSSNMYPYFGTECPGLLKAASGNEYSGFAYCQCAYRITGTGEIHHHRNNCDNSRHMLGNWSIETVTQCYGHPIGRFTAGTYILGGDDRGTVYESGTFFEKAGNGCIKPAAAKWDENCDVGTIGKSATDYGAALVDSNCRVDLGNYIGVYKCAQFCRLNGAANGKNYKYFGISAYSGTTGNCACAEKQTTEDDLWDEAYSDAQCSWQLGSPTKDPSKNHHYYLMLGATSDSSYQSFYHITPPLSEADPTLAEDFMWTEVTSTSQ